MIFTSLTFAIFLGVVFSTYWLLKRRTHQNIALVAASYFFYGWWDWRFCSLMIASTLIDYAIAHRIAAQESTRNRRLLLTASILVNFGVLGFFKYFNFFAASLQALAQSMGVTLHPITVNVILPVGISFYTFQSVGYIADVYFRRLEPSRSLTEYAAFVAFFPQLVAGPINRATHLLPQFQQPREFDYDKAVDGCRQILWGFFKKLAIADRLSPLVDAAYTHPVTMSGEALVVATVCFAFQIYCDFSAYSDIAIGTARLFGFSVARNFAYPYFSQDLGEFWRRWHISLSSWFRDYLFVPLGGSRVPRRRQVSNVLTTFTISGLWHGAGWQYLIWGALNGLAIVPGFFRREGTRKRVATDVPCAESFLPTPGEAFRIFRTFVIVCITWVFFRADSVGTAWTILERIVVSPFQGEVLREGLSTAAVLIALLIALEWWQRRWPHPLHVEAFPRPMRWCVYTSMVWLTFLFMRGAASPFIYFQF
ncbi:MAG TPA: MBOAT family O-acyltransferase [Vicinamibacterales bacterium]|jgi:D-alanyl-lipoteichoic acid acyltransferase DltB (MBOAT superfamily)